MKTLEEHNKEALEEFMKKRRPPPNGIACPQCGKELVDDNPSLTLMSCPPQKNIHCEFCDFKGTRFV